MYIPKLHSRLREEDVRCLPSQNADMPHLFVTNVTEHGPLLLFHHARVSKKLYALSVMKLIDISLGGCHTEWGIIVQYQQTINDFVYLYICAILAWCSIRWMSSDKPSLVWACHLPRNERSHAPVVTRPIYSLMSVTIIDIFIDKLIIQ